MYHAFHGRAEGARAPRVRPVYTIRVPVRASRYVFGTGARIFLVPSKSVNRNPFVFGGRDARSLKRSREIASFRRVITSSSPYLPSYLGSATSVLNLHSTRSPISFTHTSRPHIALHHVRPLLLWSSSYPFHAQSVLIASAFAHLITWPNHPSRFSLIHKPLVITRYDYYTRHRRTDRSIYLLEAPSGKRDLYSLGGEMYARRIVFGKREAEWIVYVLSNAFQRFLNVIREPFETTNWRNRKPAERFGDRPLW